MSFRGLPKAGTRNDGILKQTFPETNMTETDVVIIGAGHNGLTCAAYLAMAGLRVKVVERRKVVGGAAVTEEFHPGFKNSVAAYTVSLLNPKIIADMNLAEWGRKEIRLAEAQGSVDREGLADSGRCCGGVRVHAVAKILRDHEPRLAR